MQTQKNNWLKTLRIQCEAPLARFALAVVPRLSRRAVLVFSRLLGSATYILSKYYRTMARANLDTVFGCTKTPAEKRRIIIRSFQNFALVMLDLIWFTRDTEARLTRYCRENAPFNEKMPQGIARIAVTGHFGNWEILGQYCPRHVAPLMIVAMPLKNKMVNDILIDSSREKTGGQMIVQRTGALRHLLRHLREKHTCALLLDQNTAPKEGGIYCTFFGLPVPVSPAVATLAYKTGAEIVYVFAIPQKDGTYRCTFYDATITAAEIAALPPETAVQELTQRITTFYENLIRKNPEYWLWSYKRWKHIPVDHSGEGFPFYARSEIWDTPPIPVPTGETPC